MKAQQGEQQKTAQPTPSLGRALGLLVFAILFAVLMWLEHLWRLSRGDYPGVGLAHTWYWHVTTWAAIAFLIGRLIWALVRWRRS
jgi:hypothetical protein